MQIMSEWEAREKVRYADHASNVVFVGDDRGRVWAYDHTEEGNIFGMVSDERSELGPTANLLKFWKPAAGG